MKDLEEIPDNILRKLTVHPVKTIEEVLRLALQRNPWLDDSINVQPDNLTGKQSKKIKNNDLHTH